MTQCPNCKNKLQKRFEFCPFCGEELHRHKFTFKHIAGHFIESITHLDFKIVHYIGYIFTKPSQVVYEYLHGKQKKYFNPFIAFILCAGLLVLLMHKESNMRFEKMQETITAIKDKYPKEQYLATMEKVERAKAANEKMLSINKYFHIVNLFVYALPFWLLIFSFHKKAYNYVETVFAFMVIWTGIMLLYSLQALSNILLVQFKQTWVFLNDTVLSTIISLTIGYFFYKLLYPIHIVWFAFFSALFFLLDNFLIDYFIQFVYKLLY